MTLSYEVMRIKDQYGYELYEVWHLTDGSIAYMTREQVEDYFSDFKEGDVTNRAEAQDIVRDFPYPSEDWWYSDEELQDDSKTEWNKPTCPNCQSTNVVDHRSPAEKHRNEYHWYCKECKSDW